MTGQDKPTCHSKQTKKLDIDLLFHSCTQPSPREVLGSVQVRKVATGATLSLAQRIRL
jgi:hypothetical protein